MTKKLIDKRRLLDWLGVYYYRARARSVYDGDTLRLDIDLGFDTWRRDLKVRIAGIDAPEIRRPTLQAGKEARDYLQSLVMGYDLLVHSLWRGSYNRWVCELYLVQSGGKTLAFADWEQGERVTRIGALMVAAGHAKPW